MAATKQEQIDRLKAQLDRVREAAGHVAIGHAQKVLGAKVAGALRFSTAYAVDESEDAERVYTFDVEPIGSPITAVHVTSEGRVLIDGWRVPVSAELVIEALERDIDETDADLPITHP